jgi:hypothetical protein
MACQAALTKRGVAVVIVPVSVKLRLKQVNLVPRQTNPFCQIKLNCNKWLSLFHSIKKSGFMQVQAVKALMIS